MMSYPAAAVRAHASFASAADQPPVHTRACTPRGDDSPDEAAADDAAADDAAAPRMRWALVGTDAGWTVGAGRRVVFVVGIADSDFAHEVGAPSRLGRAPRGSLSRRVSWIRGGVAMDAEARANGADIVDATLIETDRASGALGGRVSVSIEPARLVMNEIWCQKSDLRKSDPRLSCRFKLDR